MRYARQRLAQFANVARQGDLEFLVRIAIAFRMEQFWACLKDFAVEDEHIVASSLILWPLQPQLKQYSFSFNLLHAFFPQRAWAARRADAFR